MVKNAFLAVLQTETKKYSRVIMIIQVRYMYGGSTYIFRASLWVPVEIA